jgi:predicted MPP superfamily phosphohydrolase
MKKKKNYILLAALVLTGVVLTLRMVWYETSLLQTVDYSITLEKLPAEHDGLVIALLADLHMRRECFESGLFDAITVAIRERNPDLVLLAGDYMRAKDRRSLLEMDKLSRAVSKWHGKYGTLAIAGNHDVYFEKAGNLAYIMNALKEGGVTELDNRGIALEIRGKPFQIFGVADRDDAWFRMGKIPESFDRTLPVYGMVHDPEDIYSVNNRFDMIFSGHTHQGQIRIPVFGERYLVLRFRGGWWGKGVRKHRNCVQVTTSGTGTSAWPLRLYNRPEVVFVTLRSPAVSR